MSARNPVVHDEKCSCGAEFHWIGEWATSARTAAIEWRAGHRHNAESHRNGPRNYEHPEVAPEDHRPSDRPAEIDSEDHECDSGYFDRTLCPPPCNAMHSYCDTCGKRDDPCAHDENQP